MNTGLPTSESEHEGRVDGAMTVMTVVMKDEDEEKEKEEKEEEEKEKEKKARL
ncbi:hypothetical protein Dda_2219 [Drechslerella dactyloides]|uniref:Uncharacterized protein n=1 Tax=Drechslerella dactyloides TaxID=74499 RepID=A0AAD6NL98_DREDA|nr:hypothetical protein Dda_2219 [Drechslerella dactyloides]